MVGWRAAGLALALSCLAGCAALPPVEPVNYGAAVPQGIPERQEVKGVPFYPQEQFQCGPAALATALGSAGVFRTPQELEKDVYLPQRQGSLQLEMLAATRRAGAIAYVLDARPEALLQEVAAGHPVVVLQKVGPGFLAQWHYAVVVGYDLGEQRMTLRSGRERRLATSMEEFDRSWSPAGRWAFVALPPDRLPATARESDWVAAAVALERSAPGAAQVAYQTALSAWPGNLIARIGLGNAAYRNHDLAAAREAYRQATRDHPESADAWNNLAQVLHDMGRQKEARQAVNQALALGGPHRKIYESTLSAIEAMAPR